MSKWNEYFLYVGGRRLGLSSLLSIVCSFTSLPYLCPSLDDVVQYLLRNLHSYLDIWLEVGSRADTEILQAPYTQLGPSCISALAGQHDSVLKYSLEIFNLLQTANNFRPTDCLLQRAGKVLCYIH